MVGFLWIWTDEKRKQNSGVRIKADTGFSKNTTNFTKRHESYLITDYADERD